MMMMQSTSCQSIGTPIDSKINRIVSYALYDDDDDDDDDAIDDD